MSPGSLGGYETGYNRGKWVCQRKFNGTRIGCFISADRDVVYLLTRHGTPPKQFELTAKHAKQILELNLQAGQEYWLDGELLHSKTTTPAYKERLVFYDVLLVGKYLFGVGQMERLALLADICHNPTQLEPGGIALKVSDNVWMAETWESDFVAHYKEKITMPEIEGLVLRQRASKLTNFGTKQYEIPWILRCRKPTKNYNF